VCVDNINSIFLQFIKELVL